MKPYLFLTKGIYKQININYGIVTDARGKEFFIYKRSRNDALSGDLVEIKVTKSEEDNKKAEAEISKILSRSKNYLVGVFIKRKTQEFAFIRAYNTFDGKDTFVKKEGFAGAKNDDIVVYKINKGLEKPVGEVVRIIGSRNDNDINEKIILLESGLRIEFPRNVKDEAKNLDKRFTLKNRLDLTNEIIYTIDGEDAKDLDDAVNVKKNIDGTYVLGVHIADVAEYVKDGTHLDTEAKKRGTSVYIPGEVIPMLPHELSNELCSLHPGSHKATLSIFLNIDKNGKVLDKKITESFIDSKGRLTYDEVYEYISKGMVSENLKNKTKVQESLLVANELYKIIHKRRKAEGKIEFDFPETKIDLDENGIPAKIYKRTRNDAHRLIEEFMIMANEEISKHFCLKKIPFLYRVHEKPGEDSARELANLLKEYNIGFNPEKDLTPLFLSKIVEGLKGRKEEYLISKQILLSMSKAKYDSSPLGHFGLALKYYSHFTSPIRRYPDLQIHRIIKESLNSRLDKKEIGTYAKILPKIAISCSTTEQKAEEIERKITTLKTIEYMQRFIGEDYSGKVSGMNPNGMYVELESGVEGYVIGKKMSEFKYFEEKKYFISKSLNKKIGLGDKVMIKVIKADKNMGFLDFELI